MLECSEMEELSLPDMIAAYRLMQLSGTQEEEEDLLNHSIENTIKIVCNKALVENKVNSSLKMKEEEIDCEIPLINAAKRKRYRSLDSIYKRTRPVEDVCKGGTSLMIGAQNSYEQGNCMKDMQAGCFVIEF